MKCSRGMMAACSNRLPAWFITFVFFSVVVSASSSQCPDGTYKHEGRDCCFCGAGLHLVEHCSANLTHGKCVPCEHGTYLSYPNAENRCELCTSCAQQNANLEVAETCTPARNSKCRCIKNHYCIKDGTEVCRLCYLCKECGAEGIKVACTGYSNTVCNDKVEGGNQGGIIAGIIVPIIILIAVAVAVFLWRKIQSEKRRLEPISIGTNRDPPDVEMQPLKGVDIQPHLPDIADVVGWRIMKDLAIRSSIGETAITNCQLNNPHDAHEQTLQLLTVWVERQGSNASEKLLQMLQNSGKKDKAEKVKNILSPDR